MRTLFSRKLFVAVAVLVGAMIVLSACGGSKDTGGGEGEGITVVMTDYKFEPAKIELVKGQTAKLIIKNEAKQKHNFVVEALNIAVEVDPGKSETVEVTPDETGTFKLVCTIPGHENLGMVGEIVVKDN